MANLAETHVFRNRLPVVRCAAAGALIALAFNALACLER